MAEQSLTWSQVNTWRLAQQGLAPRLTRSNLVEAVGRTGGIHALMMPAARLALWARLDGLTPQDISSALWQERTLVKTWAMRGALHLIASQDLPLYVAARSLYQTRNWVYYFDYYGVTQAQYEAYLDIAPKILNSEPMTREQFADSLTRQIHAPELQRLVRLKGWGAPLKPLAWRGDLCFGPEQDHKATFVHPARWLGSWQDVDPYASLQEIARRYLCAFGPATPENFARWWSIGITPARQLFDSLGGELKTVDIEGWRAMALSETLEPMQSLETTGSLNLLPKFDAYIVGLGRNGGLAPLLPREYQNRVYRPQGWISAVVLVDGYMRGIWEYQTRRWQTRIKVHIFPTLETPIRRDLEAEAQRLQAFLSTRVILE